MIYTLKKGLVMSTFKTYSGLPTTTVWISELNESSAVKGMNRTSKWNDAQGVAQRKSYVAVEYSNGGVIEVQSSPAMNVSQGATPEEEIVTQPKPEETVPF